MNTPNFPLFNTQGTPSLINDFDQYNTESITRCHRKISSSVRSRGRMKYAMRRHYDLSAAKATH